MAPPNEPDPFLLFQFPLSARTVATLTISGPLEPDDVDALEHLAVVVRRSLVKAMRPTLEGQKRERLSRIAAEADGLRTVREKLEKDPLVGPRAHDRVRAEPAPSGYGIRVTREPPTEGLEDAAEEGGRIPFTAP